MISEINLPPWNINWKACKTKKPLQILPRWHEFLQEKVPLNQKFASVCFHGKFILKVFIIQI